MRLKVPVEDKFSTDNKRISAGRLRSSIAVDMLCSVGFNRTKNMDLLSNSGIQKG